MTLSDCIYNTIAIEKGNHTASIFEDTWNQAEDFSSYSSEELSEVRSIVLNFRESDFLTEGTKSEIQDYLNHIRNHINP